MPLTHRGREILRRVPGGSLQSTVGVGCQIVRHEELCVGCGTCARNCPSGASERGDFFDVNQLLDAPERSRRGELGAALRRLMQHEPDGPIEVPERVTVYRTLKMLKTGGLVDELDLMHYGGDQHYYETRLKQEHAHVICLRCGKVEEFFGDPLQRLRRQIESHFNFQVLLARTEVGGYCSHCQTLRAMEVEQARRQAEVGAPAVPSKRAAKAPKARKTAAKRGI